MNLVQNASQIDYGFRLSNNFVLEHLTTGAFHNVIGKFIPQFPTALVPWMPNGIFSPGFPILQLAQNLQISAGGVLEHLLTGIGSDTIMQTGFLNNVSPATLINEMGHVAGLGIDIGVAGFVSNPFNIAKDIQSIAKNASSVTVMFGANSGYFHIDIDPSKVSANYNSSNVQLPPIISADLITGEIVNGLAAMRGYV
jgi:hypothetical protein